ncbi:MAG: DUF4437 domain-containing protein [Alphaproteobacteria bacterium]
MLFKTIGRVICGLSVAILAMGAAADEGSEIVTVPTDQLEWETTEEGVGFAALVGDRFAEPYMAMVRLPAGLVSPIHVKSANMFGVVVTGTITHVAAGADPSSEVLLPAGSFYEVPADLAHLSKCVSAVDCVTFIYQDGKFDFLPVSQ